MEVAVDGHFSETTHKKLIKVQKCQENAAFDLYLEGLGIINIPSIPIFKAATMYNDLLFSAMSQGIYPENMASHTWYRTLIWGLEIPIDLWDGMGKKTQLV